MFLLYSIWKPVWAGIGSVGKADTKCGRPYDTDLEYNNNFVNKHSYYIFKDITIVNISLPFYLFMVLQSFPWTLAAFSVSISYTYSVGLLVQEISQSQGRFIHREYMHTNIHTSIRIRTHDPSVRAAEDCSCLRPSGNCDRCTAKTHTSFIAKFSNMGGCYFS
jgi:hypothetical protein